MTSSKVQLMTTLFFKATRRYDFLLSVKEDAPKQNWLKKYQTTSVNGMKIQETLKIAKDHHQNASSLNCFISFCAN